jgi:hypothetical protein
MIKKMRSILMYMLAVLDAKGSTKKIVNMNTKGFVQPDDVDVRLAKLICKSYGHMVQKGETAEKPYRTGQFWDNIVSNNKKDFYEPIRKGDICSASVVLANFFKTSAIVGLWEGGAYAPLMKSIKRRLSFIAATLRNYDLWHVLTNEPPGVVELPNAGNPFGYRINGNIVSTAQFKLHYHARQTYNLVNNIGTKPVVAEIGGGFGGIAYYLFKMGFKGTYLNFDIPETLILSAYFLNKAFPDKNILFYDGQEYITLEDINKYDIILMPNFILKRAPDLSVDIVVNTRSFSEMPVETIREYMLQINRICRKYIYHDNANYSSHPNEIPAHSFPIPSSFGLLTKVKSVWYGGHSVQNRFVEYLYERKDQPRQ